MGLRQEEEIKLAIASIFGEENEGLLCCTLESENADGQDVSIQVMQASINISPYPFGDEPLERLEASGVMEALDEPELETVDWDANVFATIGIGDLDISEVAELVDLIFVKLLSCESATCDLKVQPKISPDAQKAAACSRSSPADTLFAQDVRGTPMATT